MIQVREAACTFSALTDCYVENTTFGGTQGFTRKPSTPWFDDNGELAGIVHQERNWTYVLIADAGHLVAQQQPGRVCPPARISIGYVLKFL